MEWTQNRAQELLNLRWEIFIGATTHWCVIKKGLGVIKAKMREIIDNEYYGCMASLKLGINFF